MIDAAAAAIVELFEFPARLFEVPFAADTGDITVVVSDPPGLTGATVPSASVIGTVVRSIVIVVAEVSPAEMPGVAGGSVFGCGTMLLSIIVPATGFGMVTFAVSGAIGVTVAGEFEIAVSAISPVTVTFAGVMLTTVVLTAAIVPVLASAVGEFEPIVFVVTGVSVFMPNVEGISVPALIGIVVPAPFGA